MEGQWRQSKFIFWEGGGNFFPRREETKLRPKTEARRAESGVGLLGRGSEPLLLPARVSGEAL